MQGAAAAMVRRRLRRIPQPCDRRHSPSVVFAKWQSSRRDVVLRAKGGRLSRDDWAKIRLSIMWAIREHVGLRGFPPSHREIEGITGIHRRHIRDGIRELSRRGEISVQRRTCRGISVARMKVLCPVCDGLWQPMVCIRCDGSSMVPWLPQNTL